MSVVKDTFFANGTYDLHDSHCSGPWTSERHAMATIPIRTTTSQQVSHAVITAAMTVHTELGLGLLESTYRLPAVRTKAGRIPGRNAESLSRSCTEDVKLELGYRLDLLVEDLVVVEIKSVDGISPVHQAQILSYLKLSGKSLGCL